MTIIAFDLDGTLCNIEHRLHLIKGEKKDWPAFFRACVDDNPVMPLLDTAKALIASGYEVEIWSGRSDAVRAETVAWLDKYFRRYMYRGLRMRKDGDYRADDVVKGEWLDALLPQDRPVLAFDDRQRVVNMWRSRGIQCCQVAPGDF